jgi:hypothetical protein
VTRRDAPAQQRGLRAGQPQSMNEYGCGFHGAG